MATWDWPSLDAFVPREVVIGARVPKTRFDAFFTGTQQTISHLADRYRATVRLPACTPEEGFVREAFFTEVVSAGHHLRLGHPAQFQPRGTLRGTLTVQAPAAAGARTLVIQGGTPGAGTLLGGDVLAAGDQLLQCGWQGATASGGVLTLPMVLPLRRALAAGTAVAWLQPRARWQLLAEQVDLTYRRGRWQQPVELMLVEDPS